MSAAPAQCAPKQLAYVISVYQGSDGEATKALYSRLERFGAVGFIAVNLFRAQKNSERAKVYRGGGYRGMAYQRKSWAMDNLASALLEHGTKCGIEWGWGEDPEQAYHRFVLYVELPNGQVSFHTDKRGAGPDAPKPFCGVRGVSAQRICWFAAKVLE